jgi:hypothetical protein
MHLVVFFAFAYGVRREVKQAHIAVIDVPRSIGILLTKGYYSGEIGANYVRDVILCSDIVTKYRSEYVGLLRVGRYSWRNNRGRSSDGLIQGFVSERIEPIIRLLQGVFAEEHFTDSMRFKSWRFPVIYEMNVRRNPLIWNHVPRLYSGVPNIGSFTFGEVFTRVFDGHSSQNGLPKGDSSINGDSYKREEVKKQFLGFTSPVFRALGYMCGTVFFTLGIVFLKKTLWKMSFNGSVNFHMGFILLMGGVLLLWVAQWCLFSVQMWCQVLLYRLN